MANALNHKGELVNFTVDAAHASAAKARSDARRAERSNAVKAQAALAATDHWAMPDYDKAFTTERKAYRDALRAIVRNPDPSQPFPVKPA